MPPLIKIKLLLNDTLVVSAIYDSGSNVSLINSKLLKLPKNEHNAKLQPVNLKTINGEEKTNGIVTLKVKVFDLEELMDVFVVENDHFHYDFLMGLDCIQKFRLTQHDDLRITQSIDIGPKYRSSDSEVKDDMCLINFNEHMNPIAFEMAVNHLDTLQHSEIEKLIEKYKPVFAKDKYDVGTVSKYEAQIDLVVEQYCSKRPYRCTPEDRKEIEGQISMLLQKNLIEESYSPFAAPVTLAFKKEDDRRTRLCIDFRDLNKIVVPQSQPFPLIEDLMVNAVNCKYFSTLDINSAFWSIPLKIQDRPKTAFVTQDGHFQWTCLPFGLKTAPAIFQRILGNIISKHRLSDFAVNFIDDILVFSKTFDDHIAHLSRLLEAILREGFRLKFSKCIFASSYAKYLGHIIENNSLRPLKDYLTAVKDFPPPETRKQVRQFLGKINFHHKFVPHSAILLDPLHNLLRKDVKFLWSEECQKSFDAVKTLLCSEPVLKIFDPALPISIYTDASLQGVGAVLKQTDENGDSRPVAYFSRKLSPAQKKKKAIYLECLAVKEAVKYWQHWLMGKHFTVYSDHKPLENMNVRSRTDEELGDLMYYLSQYDFQLKYNPGASNQEADCLSRNPVLDADDNTEDFLRVINFVTLQEIKADQQANIPTPTTELTMENGIYYKRHKSGNKIMLSEALSKKLIRRVHNACCHIGCTQMALNITPFYAANNLHKNIAKFCAACATCKKNKSRRKSQFGLMSHLGPAIRPFEIVSIDTIGGFGGARSTKKYLHLLVDHFTRWAVILTSSTQGAPDFIKLLNSVPQGYVIGTVLSDQYPGINSQIFKDFLEQKHIKLVFTSVDTAFSNGLNERLNQTLVNKIRCTWNERDRKVAWTTVAHECVAAYNETRHTVTKFAPKYLLDGGKGQILPAELNTPGSHGDLSRDRKLAFENTLRSHNYNKKNFDRSRKAATFAPGDEVYVENGNRLNRKKLDELRMGPYKILRQVSNSIYEVDVGHRKSESNLYHVSKISPVCCVFT